MAKRRGPNEGSIYQRQDGHWVASLQLPNGKRKSYYATSRKEVIDRLRSAQRAVEDGADLRAERMTIAQFLDKWLTASAKPATRHKTFTTYESLCRTAIVPRIGKR